VAEEILKTCIMLSINEGFSEEDLNDTARAWKRVLTYYADRKA